MKYGCRSKNEKCQFCEKRCLTKSALRKHKERHHKQEYYASKAAIPIEKLKVESEKEHFTEQRIAYECNNDEKPNIIS